MFGDSNTGTPDTPPVSNGGSGNGNGEEVDPPDPPDTPDPPGEEESTIDMLVVTGRVDKFSKEGQKPDLSGIAVEIWYKNGGIVDAKAADIFTIPAILGEAEINNEANATALPVAISIYHKDDQSVRATVMLPGVNALVSDNRGTTAGNMHGDGWGYSGGQGVGVKLPAVFGNDANTGVDILTTSYSGELFQDGEAPDATSISVYVKYQGFDTFTSTWLEEANEANNGAETGEETDGSKYLWETLKLTQDHIFSDYNASFRSGMPTASATKRYAYGIDEEENNIYFLVSRGRFHGGGAAVNSSIYIKVPFAIANYRYVRAVEVESLTWESGEPGKYAFLTQAEALAVGGRAAWTTKLLTRSGLKLKVYFDNYSEGYKIRDITFFQRAVRLGVAGVVNDPTDTLLLDSSEAGFGEIMIGYYTSAPFDSRDPILKGDFTNVAVEALPIATFVEGSGELKRKASAKEEKDLEFIVKPNAGKTGPDSSWTGAIRDEDLKTIQNTYDFWGSFVKDGQTVPGKIIPGDDFRQAFFPGTPIRGDRAEIVDAEVSFVVPRQANMVTAGLSAAKAKQYSLFSGEEGMFNAKVYPYFYDQW